MTDDSLVTLCQHPDLGLDLSNALPTDLYSRTVEKETYEVKAVADLKSPRLGRARDLLRSIRERAQYNALLFDAQFLM